MFGANCVFAQPGETDVGEVSVYGGASFGSLGSHAAVGGSVGLALARYAVVLFETTYVPLCDRALVPRPGVVARSSGLYDFNFAVNVRVPYRDRWEPYGILAPTMLYNRYDAQSIQPNGSISRLTGQSNLKFGFETGAGLRYYVRKSWGIRGEYRYTIATQNFSRLVGGVFYHFDEGSTPFRFLKGRIMGEPHRHRTR
jgi:opacity protein-like surface antigen